jgi:AAA domain/Bifunctional DNA primase/polymerase, N-terminal
MGVPVFTARLNSDGDPYPPKGWEKTAPSHDLVDKWKPGMALCAVTGVVFDVIDIDPRNGGDLSFKRLAADLGEDGPEEWWRVRTASGGKHLWITALGIGSHPGFLPGIDLKGGLEDGSSRGFVFLPPTVRPSKGTENYGERMPYRQMSDLLSASGGPCEVLAAYVEAAAATKGRGPGKRGRADASSLRAACISAEEGGQRAALLSYAAELQKRGMSREETLALLRAVVIEMPAFDPRRPWIARGSDPDRHLKGLLYAEGQIIGDAAPGELDGLAPMVAREKVELRTLGSVEHRQTTWQWYRYLAMGDMTILDADPGTAKSLISLDLAARYTRGRPMPGEPEAIVPPGNVLLLAPEDRAEVIRMRMDAAGADLSRVFLPPLTTVGRGKNRKATYKGELVTFPDGMYRFREWILGGEIGFVVIDPIAAFLSESVNSHNDASVRRALEPLGTVLGEAHCSALLIRHLNKDTSKDVRFRGSGSVAFGAVSRIQLFAAPLPSDVGVAATHGIVTVKNNHLAKRPDDCLTYAIIDSPIAADDQGSWVPMLEWHGTVEVSPQYLASGGRSEARRGPEPVRQKEIESVLEELFAVREEVPVKDILAALEMTRDELASSSSVKKVKHKLQIRSCKTPEGPWVWTVAKEGPSRRRGRRSS